MLDRTNRTSQKEICWTEKTVHDPGELVFMDKSYVASMVKRSENQHWVCEQNSGNDHTKGVSQTATRIPMGIVSVSQ